ncbi:hypothetical protein E2562_021873 [Oryza meyeriana var. granulata]|uniref:Uncharacterized protein n=1 Tax=Oryza meyeriana var. granulata TaxID=110450 RepID=A0A6G1C7B1_9ORYZ|nr:hypothetical protein E2562_021873 [Oryza meyeriana var. granulata]
MAAIGPNDFPVSSLDDVLALENVFGRHPLVWARVVVLELDRLNDAVDVLVALEYARDTFKWVVVGMNQLAMAAARCKDLAARKLQLTRMLDRASAVTPIDLGSHASGRELLDALFSGPLPGSRPQGTPSPPRSAVMWSPWRTGCPGTRASPASMPPQSVGIWERTSTISSQRQRGLIRY